MVAFFLIIFIIPCSASTSTKSPSCKTLVAIQILWTWSP